MTFSLLSLLVNVVAWVAGIATCRLLFHNSRGATMSHEHKPFLTTGRLAVALGAVLILLGVQQIQFQNTSDDAARVDAERTECIGAWGEDMSEWGAGVVDTIGTRTDATAKRDKATVRKDEALDDIIGVVIGARATPPLATEKDFDKALAEFAAAKSSLLKVTRETAQTREENPYPKAPELDCD